jgi:hypothetical protein
MIQPNPRMRDEMKNGHCIAVARMRPPGTFVRTTTMAIGTAMARDKTVVSPAKSTVFSATFPKPASVNRRA